MDILIYENGKHYNPPLNPLLDKWNKMYPPIPQPNNSQVCDDYSCMWCGRCPNGEYWSIPDEDKNEYDQWVKEYNHYHKNNGELDDIIITFD